MCAPRITSLHPHANFSQLSPSAKIDLCLRITKNGAPDTPVLALPTLCQSNMQHISPTTDLATVVVHYISVLQDQLNTQY